MVVIVALFGSLPQNTEQQYSERPIVKTIPPRYPLVLNALVGRKKNPGEGAMRLNGACTVDHPTDTTYGRGPSTRSTFSSLLC